MSDDREDADRRDPTGNPGGPGGDVAAGHEAAPGEYPLEKERPGVVSGEHDRHGQSRTTNPGQSSGEFDRGVDTEHLRSPSQGARPEDLDRATEPDQG